MVKYICIFLLAFAINAYGATYYVSKDTGDDSNSGAEGSPWEYCPGLTGWTGSATLSAGDTVYFDSSDTWTGSGSQLLNMVGGVTYIGDTWGGGTRAILQSTANHANGTVWMGYDNATYETVLQGFDVRLNNHSGEVITINRPSVGNMTGETKRIENCIVTNSGYTTAGENHGLRIGAPDYPIDDIEIIDNVIHAIPGDGLMAYSKYNDPGEKISNVTFRGNVVYDVGNAADNQQCGIYIKNQVENATVEFNTVYDCPGDGIRVVSDGPSIDPTGITIRHNIIYDIDKRGVNSQQRAYDTSVVDIYGNIIYECVSHGIYYFLNNSTITSHIYNNTIYNNGGYGIRFDTSSATYTVLSLYNNITYSNSYGTISDPGGYITASGTNLSTNPLFYDLYDLPTGFSGSYGVDMEPNTDGLSTGTSPAVNAGTDLGTSYNSSINTVTRTGSWDIGAYEYSAMSAGTTIIDEDFDDQSYSSPLSLYVYDAYDEDVPYSATQAYGGSGYSIAVDHVVGDVMATVANIENYLDEGLYFRYYVYYPAAYYWPGEQSLFENVKMLKIAGDAGEEDIEFIYKNSASDGPDNLQLVWFKESDGTFTGGTGTGNTTLGGTLSDDEWHKIEIYIHIPTSGDSTVHVQVDDYDVYESTDADIALPTSEYDNTRQFISIRASNSPSSGHGVWYFDEIIVVHDGGDLCDNEPGGGDTTAPTVLSSSVNGSSATINCSEDVAIALLDDGDFVMTGSTTGAVDLVSCTEGSGVISCTAAISFSYGETVTLAYSGGADEVEDLAGNDMATFSGASVTNSTGAPSTTVFASRMGSSYGPWRQGCGLVEVPTNKWVGSDGYVIRDSDGEYLVSQPE